MKRMAWGQPGGMRFLMLQANDNTWAILGFRAFIFMIDGCMTWHSEWMDANSGFDLIYSCKSTIL